MTLLPDDEMVPLRRRLRQRLKVWESTFGRNSWVARLVRKGVTLPFTMTPTPYRCFREVTDVAQREVISTEVSEMVRRGVIRRARPRAREIVSRIFCVAKKGTNKLQPCLDLRPLNRFLDPPRFRLEGLPVLRQLVQHQDFCCSIDLSSAYWHVPLARGVKRWFRFAWEGRTYEFDVLPFGVSIAPWVFWKILRPWAASLRAKGVRLTVYLDDILIMGRSPEECARHTQMVADSLQALGFCLNVGKSVLDPTQRIKFLGVEVDTVEMTFSLPDEKIRTIARSCRRLANYAEAGRSQSLRSLSRTLGQITAAGEALLAHRRRSVELERARAQALRKGVRWDEPCPLSAGAVSELRWWSANLRRCPGRPIRLPTPSIVLTTDASAMGWGCIVTSCSFDSSLVGRSFGGRLPDDLTQRVSNETELYAIEQSVRTMARMTSLRGRHVRIRTDNTAAMFYVNRGGGRSLALSKRARPLWDTCARRGVALSAEHLPGEDNLGADAISRRKYSPADWRLKTRTFRALMKKFRYAPTIDAFAEPANTQLRRFASRYPVPGSLGLGGLELDYAKERAFCFPPPRLVGQLLTTLTTQRAKALLVVPSTRGAHWWPLLEQGAVRKYVFKARYGLDRRFGKISYKNLRLMAILYCGDWSKRDDTRNR